MYFNKDKNENEEENKRNIVNKNMVNHKNKKYIRNIKQSAYNIKYINKFYKRNNDIKVKKSNNVTAFNNNSLNANNLKLENKNHQQSYFNKGSVSRNNKENTRLNAYKKNYFDQDNINYNSLINSQTSVCSIHIEKTDEDIKNQIKYTESYLYNNRNNLNEISQKTYPMFVEEINFNENLVLLTGILILSSNDKIFNNLEFEGKTNPSPIDCNLSVYVNVVNKYNYHYFKQLYPASYNFKNRLLFASLNNSTIDSSLLIDKIIIKGCFKTLSLIVLGQSEEVNEALKYYKENIYDSNLRSKINEDTLDVENVDLEKNDIYAPRKPVDIKTYNINTIMEENVYWKKYNKINDFYQNYVSTEDNNKELYELSNILEEEFIKNNVHEMNKSDNNDLKSELKNSQTDTSHETNVKKNEETLTNNKNDDEMDENIENNENSKVIENNENSKVIENNENSKVVENNENFKVIESNENFKGIENNENSKNIENNDVNSIDSKIHSDNKKKPIINYFIPPRNDLIIKILNLFTERYKSKKEICKSDILIYKKIIKYGALWIFYIYKNIKNEEDFFLNYSKYMEIKISDVLGCLLILRRCALYSNLSKYIIHMNFNSDVLYFDNKSPYVLIYLIDILHVNNIYFLSSWKIKTSILKTIIALISNSYVMNLFCNYVDENNESSYKRLLKLSSNNKMKRYNIKRLLGIIMSRVKLFEEISKFESTIIDVIINRRNYDKTLFSKKFITKFIYNLKSVHKELFQHTCNHESKNSCYDALYENEIFVFDEKNKKTNFYSHKLHNYIISYLQKNQFFTLFLYILKEFDIHIKNSLFLNSYDICFITAVNDFLFYILNCSGGINLLINYNIELFENLYKNICLIINRKMKEINSNIIDKSNDLNKLKSNDDNYNGANDQISRNNEDKIDDIDNISEDNFKIKNGENDLSYEFEDPYSENAALKDTNKNTALNDNKNIINMSYKNDNVNEFSNTIDSLKDEVENIVNLNNYAYENNTKEEKELLNSLDDINDDFIYNEKNFYYDNLKCVYTYNDILRNKDMLEQLYLDGYNCKDIKNTRNYCSFILCSLKTFSKTNTLINNFFNSGAEISLEYLKFFNVLCSYPLSKLALYKNINFYNFFHHIIYLFYYFIYLEKLYENKMNETIRKKERVDHNNEEEEDSKEKKKNCPKNINVSNKIEESDNNVNEFVLISIRYILNIIYNLIFYDESGYFIFHFGYSIFVCLEEIKNITGEIKKKKDYSFGTLNNEVPKKLFLKDYISNDKLFYKYFFHLYENLKNLYIDLYRYEKKKFNEMDISKKKEAYKESIFNILNKYNQQIKTTYTNKTNTDEKNKSINNDIDQIKQNIFNNEEIFTNLLPLKSNYIPNINKIIESCKIEKDKYVLKKSKELNNYNCKLNNDIYINQSSKNCTRLGTTNNQYVELLEELDDIPSNDLSRKLDMYPFLSLNLLYYYMNLCYNINYFMNVYENEKEEQNQDEEFFFINNSGFFYNNDFEYYNYICIKNDKLDEINKPIKDTYFIKKKNIKISSEKNNYINNNGKEIYSDDYLNSINYMNKYDHNNFKNIGTILYHENNLEFIIKLISKSIFFLNVNIFKLALLNFNKLSGRNLYKILKNRLKSIYFVKSVLNVLFNFFYNLTYNNNSITLKSYRNNELLYSLLYLLNKLLSFNDWIGSNNISEYNHHSSIFVLRYNIIYILRIFNLWFNKTSDNQSFLFRSVLKYTRALPSFSTAGMLLILTFFDFKNIFPEYIYSFYITKNLKKICYDSIKNNVESNECDDEEEEKEETLEESELEEKDYNDDEEEYEYEYEMENIYEHESEMEKEDYLKQKNSENEEIEHEQGIKKENISSNLIKKEKNKCEDNKNYSENEEHYDEQKNKERKINNGMNIQIKDKGDDNPNNIIDDNLYYGLCEEQNEDTYKYGTLNEEEKVSNDENKYEENMHSSKSLKTEKDHNIMECDISKEKEENENRKEDKNEMVNDKTLHNTHIKNENGDLKEDKDIFNKNRRNSSNINDNNYSKEKQNIKDSSIINGSQKYDKLILYKNNCETFNYYSHILNNSTINYVSDLEEEEENDDNKEEEEENGEFIENRRKENMNSNIIKEKKEDLKENLSKGKDLEKIILYCKLNNPFNVEKSRNLYLCCSINVKKKIMNEKYCEHFRVFNLNYSSDDYEETFFSDNNKILNDNYASLIGNLTINLKDLNENGSSTNDTSNQANYNFLDENILKNYIGNKIKGISFLSTDNHYKNKKYFRGGYNENNNLDFQNNYENNNFTREKKNNSIRRNDKKENDYIMYKNKIGDINNKEKLYNNTSEEVIIPFSIKNFIQDGDEMHYENILDKLRREEYLYDQNINMNSLKEEEKEKLNLIRKELKIREYTNFEDFCDYINFIIRISKSNNIVGRCLSAYCCVIFINHRIPIFSILFDYVLKTICNLKNLNSFNKNNDDTTSICMNKINYFSFFSYNNTQSNNAYYTYNQEIYHLKELCNIFSFILDILKICFFNNYKNNYNKLIKLLYLPSKKLLNILYSMIKTLKKVFPQELIRFIIKLSSTIFQGYAYVLFIFFNKHNILYNEDNFEATRSKEDASRNIDNNVLFINKEVYYKEKEYNINQDMEEKIINKYQHVNENYKKKILFSCPNYIKYINFFINYFFELINTKNVVDSNNKEILYKYADYVDIRTVNLCLINIYEIIKNKILYFFTFFNAEKKLVNLFFRYIHNYKDKMKMKTIFHKNDNVNMREFLENHNNEIMYIHIYDFCIKLNKCINIGKLLEFFSFYFDIIEEINYKIIELYEYINIIDIILNIILKIINYNFNSLFVLMNLVLNDSSSVIKFVRIQQNKNNIEKKKILKGKKKFSSRNENEKRNYYDTNYIENFKNNFLNNLLSSLNTLHLFIINAIEKNYDEDANNTKQKDLINKKDKTVESSQTAGINGNEKTNNEISNQNININKNGSLYILSKIILSMIDKVKSIKKKVLNLNISFISNITFKNFLLFACYDLKELNILYKNQNLNKHNRMILDNTSLSCEIPLKRRKQEEEKKVLDTSFNEIKTDVNKEIEHINSDDINYGNILNANKQDENKSSNELNENGLVRTESNENVISENIVKRNILNEKDASKSTLDTELLNNTSVNYVKRRDYSFFFENMFNDINLMINNKYLFSKLSDIFFSKSVLNKITRAYESYQHLDDNYLLTIKNINSNNLIPSVNKKLYDYCSHFLCDIQSKVYLNENDEDRKSFTLFNIAQENKSKEIDENHSLYNYIKLLKEESSKLQKKKAELNSQLLQSKGKQFKRIDKNTFEDHFRNRKTLSSRAPSKHVDDYEASNATTNNNAATNNNNVENEETANENNENFVDLNNKNKFNNVINKSIINQDNKASNALNNNTNKINVNNNINNSNDFVTNINNDNTSSIVNANITKNDNYNITLNKNSLTNNLGNKVGIDVNKEMKQNDSKNVDNLIKMVPGKVNILRNTKKFHNTNHINKDNYNNNNNNNSNNNDNFNYNSQNNNHNNIYNDGNDNYNNDNNYNDNNYENYNNYNNNYNNNLNNYNSNYNYNSTMVNNTGIDIMRASNYSSNTNNNINNSMEFNSNIKIDINNNQNMKINDYNTINNLKNNENIMNTSNMKDQHNTIPYVNTPFFNYNKNDISNNNDIDVKDNNNIAKSTNENNNSQNSNYTSSINFDVNNNHFMDSSNMKHVNNNEDQNNMSSSNINKSLNNETRETNELNKNSTFDDCDCYKFNVLGWKEFSQDGHKNDLDVCKIVNKPVLLRDPRIKMKFLKILDRHKNIKDIFKRLGVDIK